MREEQKRCLCLGGRLQKETKKKTLSKHQQTYSQDTNQLKTLSIDRCEPPRSRLTTSVNLNNKNNSNKQKKTDPKTRGCLVLSLGRQDKPPQMLAVRKRCMRTGNGRIHLSCFLRRAHRASCSSSRRNKAPYSRRTTAGGGFHAPEHPFPRRPSIA